jgi:tetratricopeptide (TPR) repeat protein
VRDEAVDPEVLEHLKALGYVDPKPAARPPGAASAPDLEALRREAAQHPDDPKSLARLAEGCLRAGRLDEARAEADRALAVDPLFAPAHHVLGGVHEAEGRRDAAVRAYRNALRCNPRFEPSRQAHERLTGSPDPLAPRTPAEARAVLLTAEASRAAALLDYRAALRHLEEAERLAPRFPVIFQYRSNIHFLMGDEAAAVDALRAGLRAVPGDVLFRENLRRLLEDGKGDESPGRPKP